jgi:hypothetical protein
MENIREAISKAKDCFELADLISSLKYRNYQRTVDILRLQAEDSAT